jgi:hypothetical protein
MFYSFFMPTNINNDHNGNAYYYNVACVQQIKLVIIVGHKLSDLLKFIDFLINEKWFWRQCGHRRSGASVHIPIRLPWFPHAATGDHPSTSQRAAKTGHRM